MEAISLKTVLENYRKTKDEVLTSLRKALNGDGNVNKVAETFSVGDLFSFGKFLGMIVDEGENCYWCCKVSEFIEMVGPYDVIVNIGSKRFIVETSNAFIVPKSLMGKAFKAGTLSETDFDFVIKAYDGEKISSHKTGEEFVPDDLRFLFLKEEGDLVRKFAKLAGKTLFSSTEKLQTSDKEENNCIILSFIPEDVFEIVAADTENKVEYADDFVLLREGEGIKIFPSKKFVGKRGMIRIFGKEKFYESVPGEIILKSKDEKLSSVPLSILVGKIKIERESDKDEV
ncbi:hypothetical protein [Desulfurobacterium atlanticum]|uniref:Uncharacterized protein n=1 Tax=Desulfurobacterium atlanticum TaxID=240169 RepID=A0A238XVB5_9BACT|nr:hypothetical protein [Desulfurobacterium atlanticum]SNR62877.1 hypothetical protein SAMN06265340_101298 [Desulfurobacterium atlanticum]